MTLKFYDASGPFGELSNFFLLEKPIIYEGLPYRTSEHLYHALKYLTHPNRTKLHEEYAELIRNASTPNKAKILANRKTGLRYQWQKDLKVLIDKYNLEPRSDWDAVKEEKMLLCLKLKFTQSERCKKVLLSTGDQILVEHTSRDKFWADGGDGSGLNTLGQLLMQVREELIACEVVESSSYDLNPSYETYQPKKRAISSTTHSSPISKKQRLSKTISRLEVN
jgi:ribA/ribD-fused uncharacterized protein